MTKKVWNLDANLRNADWLKTTTWDLPTDKTAFIAHLASINKTVTEFMALPAAEAMPDTLKRDLAPDQLDDIHRALEGLTGVLGSGTKSLEFKVRHVRTPSAWPGNPPVGTPLPLGPEWTNEKPDKPTTSSPKRTRREKMFDGYHPATDEERAEFKIPPGWTNPHVADDLSTAIDRVKAFDSQGRPQRQQNPWAKVAAANQKYARNKELTKLIPQLDDVLDSEWKTNENAAVLRLIRITGIRNGDKANMLSDEDTAINANQLKQALEDGTYNPETFKPAKYVAYGASNLEARHVTIDEDAGIVHFQFIGKKRVPIELRIRSNELVELMKHWKGDKEGNERIFPTSTPTRNLAFLKKHTGPEYKVHDLRTFKANAVAIQTIAAKDGALPTDEKEFIAWRNEVGEAVSDVLGNDRKEAIDSYIDPIVFEQWRNPEWGRIKGDVLHEIPE